ncbi:MAG: metallophosphoesterase [Bacteroidetes bacterium]|nr:metallophosphoesterase [Bacteroidota bacterium]
MKSILFFASFVVFIATVDFYAYQAIKTFFDQNSKTGNIIKIFYWSIPLFLILTIIFISTQGYQNTPLWVKRTAGGLFFFGLLAKFFIIFWLFGEDIYRVSTFLFQKVFGNGEATFADRRKFISRMSLISALAPIGILTYGVVKNAYNYKFYNQKIKIPNLPENFKGKKIIQLSDIHAGTFNKTAPIEKVVAEINKLQPDYIFFTGDLVNDLATEMDDYLPIFKKLEAKYGIYSILGNHDYGDYFFGPHDSPEKTANFNAFLQVHKKLGWDLMRNENRRLEIDGQSIGLIGVENYSEGGRFVSYGDLAKAYKGIENEATKILLSHDPSHWDAVINKNFKDIDLTLSGHTHGFQFGVETKWLKWSPSQYTYKQWAGLYQKEKQQIYVNRGFGNLGYPGRIGILPEVTVIELA